MERSTQDISNIEIDKYLKEYEGFQASINEDKNKPTLNIIRQVQDSADKKLISFSRSIIEPQKIPVSSKGDTLERVKVYADEGIYRLKGAGRTTELLTAQLSKDINDNTFTFRDFAKLNANNLPIHKRVSGKEIDSVLSKEFQK